MSYYASFKNISALVAVLCALLLTGCAASRKGETTADGLVIPPRKPLQFASYEYLCEPTFGKNPAEMEHLLDRYGAQGWRLAGFMQKGGDTSAFCLFR